MSDVVGRVKHDEDCVSVEVQFKVGVLSHSVVYSFKSHVEGEFDRIMKFINSQDPLQQTDLATYLPRHLVQSYKINKR